MTVIISIMNAIGDVFLAQSAILSLIDLHCKDKVILVIPSDVDETVLKYLEIQKIVLKIDRSFYYPYYNFTEEINFIKSQFDEVDIFYSLTKFFHLPEYDLKIIEAFNPRKIIKFEKNEVLSLKHSKTKYLDFFKNVNPQNKYKENYTPIIPEELEKDLCRQIMSNFNHKPYVVFHTDTAEPKQWSDKGWNHLIEQCKYNFDIVLIGKPKSEIVRLFYLHGAKIVKSDWHLSCLFIKYATFFVGVDSCFAHIADSYKKKGFVVWGKSTEKSEYDKLLRKHEFELSHNNLFVNYSKEPTQDIPADYFDHLVKSIFSSANIV